ncbi:hypothetical protein [Mycobacterium sp. MS1601]|uniref:RraA family protein n=1 Tax=Mycobacterium sp. MS1601 TaxID=1936029 RepID=UPI00178CE4C7|nr:hypothetical protein [Mycobacterium sp. MS1601]
MVPDLEVARAFFCDTIGSRVVGDGRADGTAYLQVEIGETAVNLFVQPIFTDADVATGWSHVSLETNDLDCFLASPDWQPHLIGAPKVIETLSDTRRIAFFEPLPCLRVEVMQIARLLPPPSEVPGVSTLYEANGRRGESRGLLHRAGAAAVLGTALTARCQPGDNLAVHRAVAQARPGDVLVVAGADVAVGYVGDVLVNAALRRGIVGILVDGGVRDIDELLRLDLPVWSTRLAITAAAKVTPGEVATTVSFAGTSITNGDIVRADRDGAVAVPAAAWPTVLDAARARDAFEAGIIDRLDRGETTVQILGLAE